MSSIGKLIREKRIECGLSQDELGKKCHLNDSDICKIEQGNRKKVGWQTICMIAKELSVHPFEFLLVEGYITEQDIHPANRLNNLDQLTEKDIQYIQMFIDGILANRVTKKAKQEECDNGI